MDLHIHSAYSSDGEIPVAGIAERCAASGTAIFSTDHNCVRGLDEAAGCASKAGLGFVPGIEVDCNFEGIDLHLLGYGIDRRSRDFASLEQDVAAKVTEAFGETGAPGSASWGLRSTARRCLRLRAGSLPTLELVAEVMLSDAADDTPLLAPYREGGARGDTPYWIFIWITGAGGGLRSCLLISWITGMPSPDPGQRRRACGGTSRA